MVRLGKTALRHPKTQPPLTRLLQSSQIKILVLGLHILGAHVNTLTRTLCHYATLAYGAMRALDLRR
jgi:hypothetical protein